MHVSKRVNKGNIKVDYRENGTKKRWKHFIITHQQITAKVNQLKGLVTRRGAEDILVHIGINKQKYGQNIYNKFYKTGYTKQLQ